jgi:hypothetical protein
MTYLERAHRREAPAAGARGTSAIAMGPGLNGVHGLWLLRCAGRAGAHLLALDRVLALVRHPEEVIGAACAAH